MTNQHDVKKEYRTDRIEVSWEPTYCIHAQRCVGGLPAVFNRQDRPWIHPDAASPDEIAQVISTCPSGALHFRRLDDGPREAVPEVTTITVARDGPLGLHGDIEIRDADGVVIRRDTRVTLCRCGASQNKPFCDLSHKAIGFKDPGAQDEPWTEAERRGRV
jgi:uncharacterized Fe-S cluster protein YjdI/CDGSH-type Zn-finger protein